jgi:hypothetical protein
MRALLKVRESEVYPGVHFPGPPFARKEIRSPMSFPFTAAFLSVVLAPGLVLAQDPTEPDAEGCRDTPVLTRLSGCRIMRCESKEFDAMDLQVGAVKESGDAPMRTLEGATDTITWPSVVPSCS